MPTEGSRLPIRCALIAVLAFAGKPGILLAQSERGGWSLQPRVTVSETITDNVVTGSSTPRSDNITQVSPGVRFASRGARVKLSADYSLNELIYARDSSRNERQNSLNAFGTVEAIENWFFVDLNWAIFQQNISAFGAQSASNVNVDANRTETSNARVSPYIRGSFGDFANYDLRYNQSRTDSKSNLASDSEAQQWTGRVAGGTRFASLGWAINYNKQINRVSNGNDTENVYSNVELNYRLNPELRFALRAGHDSQEIASSVATDGSASGVSLDWTPSQRTSLTANADKRAYGNTHSVVFNHRTPLTAWRFVDTRDATLDTSAYQNAGRISTYDLMYAQLASSVPDPAIRAQQVTELLRQNGIPATATVNTGFLSSRVSVQRHQELSLVLLGKRNTVTYTWSRLEHDALGASTGVADDFATNSNIRQRGFSSNWAYRLTEITSLGIANSRQVTSGDGSGTRESEHKQLTLNVTTRFGPKTSASLAATRANSTGQTERDENTMVGTVSMRF